MNDEETQLHETEDDTDLLTLAKQLAEMATRLREMQE